MRELLKTIGAILMTVLVVFPILAMLFALILRFILFPYMKWIGL